MKTSCPPIIPFPKINEWDMNLPDAYIEMRLRDIESLESKIKFIELNDMQSIGVLTSNDELLKFKAYLSNKCIEDKIYFTTLLANRYFSAN